MIITNVFSLSYIRLVVDKTFTISLSLSLKGLFLSVKGSILLLNSWLVFDDEFLWGVVVFLLHIGRHFVHHVELWIHIELGVHFEERSLHLGWHDGVEAGKLVNNGLKNSDFFVRVLLNSEIGEDGLSGISISSDVLFRGLSEKFS
jgi:hypothetical protein